jgi:ketosteroid isomerase-like protein
MKIKYLSIIFCFFFGCCGNQNRQSDENIKQDVWNTVKSINRHWAITENMDSLSLFFHDDMVMFFPGGKERLHGKNNIIKSYENYVRYAETVSLSEYEPMIQLYNDNKTAIVTYFGDLTIKTPAGTTQTFFNKDMYTLIFENGRWQAVAQHYSFFNK